MQRQTSTHPNLATLVATTNLFIMACWTRDQLLLALNLYHQTPFGKQHSTHPPIVALAEKIDRTPSAVAMKLSNFTFLDPAEGGKGLSGASKADREIWREFYENLEALVDESEPLLTRDPSAPSGPTETQSSVTQRRHQSFFRRAVLGCYENRCCISGLTVPSLLRASHTIPWSVSKEHRLDPSNGLCLAGTFDLAFDQFFISIDENLRLVIGETLQNAKKDKAVVENFLNRSGQTIQLPEKNPPQKKFLAWHFANLR